MSDEGWSVSRFIRESGMSRTTIYDWLNTDSTRTPSVDLVQRYAENLQIPYEPYAEALGWTETEAAPPKDLEGFIRRAKALAEHPGTSAERRRTLEARIRVAEAMLKEARDMEKDAEALIRGVFEANDDVPDR